MPSLPLLGKHIVDLQEVFLKRKYGWSGIIFGLIILSILLGGTVIGGVFLVKNTISPQASGAQKAAKTLGIETTITITPSPTPITTTCANDQSFDNLWDFSLYQKDKDGYYLPNEKSTHSFLYPPIAYKNKISSLFQRIDIEYVASYQDTTSTSSATFFIAIYDDNHNEILELNFPEPNRQLIGVKRINFSDTNTPITPEPIAPIILGRQISYTGTHAINITSNKYNQYDNTITYIVAGHLIDNDNNQQNIYREIPIKLATVDPTIKEFRVVIGTGRQGKLKIKKLNICDK